MDTPKKKVRFEIKNQLGEGSFSKSFRAYDNKLKQEVALKVEKENKNKKILKFEYEILKALQSDTYVPKVYEFIENKNSNFIVMELLGKNVATFKKFQGEFFTDLKAYDILLQMLDSIEILHDKGYIHRDIKPSNFVIGIDEEKVYMVDFGLAKIHLDENGVPVPPREKTEFRGTLTYASLNAHNKNELSRRDDLFSFFFVILDLLNECLLWRTCNDDKDEIKKKKEECLSDPENLLLLTTCKGKLELIHILNYIKTLNYEDRPDYALIRKYLQELRKKELTKQSNQVKFSLLNNDYRHHVNTYDNDHSKVNLFKNFTLDSSLYVVNPNNTNNNFSTNLSTNNASLPYFLTMQQNSTISNATFNTLNFKDNFTGLNQQVGRINSTQNHDFSIKQPILKKKRKRISIKEECIDSDNFESKSKSRAYSQAETHNVRIDNELNKEEENRDGKIYLNNSVIPAQNYFLFAENLKHLKKDDFVQPVPLYFPHHIGGIPGFGAFNINPVIQRQMYNIPFIPAINQKCICYDKDGLPYLVLI